MGKTIMLQGTGSDVGKSVLVTALCRIFAQAGYKVAPFKSQNMALNSGVTADGKEIGRAQYLQAQAAGVEPSADMNPILLKPSSDTEAQVVVLGKAVGKMTAQEYIQFKPRALEICEAALQRLRADYDIVVIEGAGSPAEVNLREHDIVNMPIAKLAEAPVFLVANIDLGGVFAYAAGTLRLLQPWERQRVAGIIVNKLRGQASHFESGRQILEQITGVPVAGVIPYIEDLWLPEEDAIAPEKLVRAPQASDLKIGVIWLPHLSNFTDFDALQQEPGVALEYLKGPQDLAGFDLLLLPGSKNTIDDLSYLYQSGTASAIKQAAVQGVPVFGICGGFQMLGTEIYDRQGLEASAERMPGLGLLHFETEFSPDKVVRRVTGRVTADHGLFAGCKGLPVSGYEIHMGRSQLRGTPLLSCEEQGWQDGLVSLDGRIGGTYMHGIFDQREFRQTLLKNLGSLARRTSAYEENGPALARTLDENLDHLAACVGQHLDLGFLYRTMGVE